MKVHRKIALTIAALVLAGIFTGTANAQQAIVKDAHFTLPFKAKWEDTVLRPGDYTLSVTRVSDGRYPLYRVDLAGAGKEKAILALGPLGPRVGKRSMLVAAYNGSIYSIRALHLPTADLILTFPAPKAEQQTMTAEATGPVQNVPILVAAK